MITLFYSFLTSLWSHLLSGPIEAVQRTSPSSMKSCPTKETASMWTSGTTLPGGVCTLNVPYSSVNLVFSPRRVFILRDCYHLGIKNNFDYSRCLMFSRVCEVKGRKQICFRDKVLLTHRRSKAHRLNLRSFFASSKKEESILGGVR